MPAPVDRTSADFYTDRRAEMLTPERMVSESLRAGNIPANEILRTVRPPVPMAPNARRYGYRRDPLTIGDIIATNRWAPQFRSWVSGAPAQPRADADAGYEAGLVNFIQQQGGGSGIAG